MKIVHIGLLIMYLLINATALPALADSVPSWTWANPVPQGNYLNASVTGGGVSVAVGGGGILYSNAGGTWDSDSSGTINTLYDVTYGNGIFAAVGPSDTIITSSDGVHWITASITSTTQNLYSIAYGNNTFVAAGSNGIVIRSNDGVTWTISGGISSTTTVTGITFGLGLFVAVAHDNSTGAPVILDSSDGITWTAAHISAPPADAPVYIAFNGNVFVAMGLNVSGSSGGSIMTSPDGTNWTTQAPLSPAASLPISITTNGTTIVVMLQSGSSNTAVTNPINIETSPDGVHWTQVAANNLPASWSQNIPRYISYTGSVYLVVGASGYIATSPDMVNWTAQSPMTTVTLNRLSGVHWFNNQFFAVGDDDTILTSTDGITWTKQGISVSKPSNLRDIAYSGKLYVIVGSNGIVLTSSDGANWSANQMTPAVPPGVIFTGVAWNGTLFVAVGTAGAIYTSPDGLTWSAQNSGTEDNLWGVVWMGTYFVAVSDSKSDAHPIWISQDGINWKSTPFNVNNHTELYSIHWDGVRLIVSGAAVNSSGLLVGFMATAPDCFCWTNYYSNVRDVFSDAMFNGNQYIAVGQSTVYTSSDGNTWTMPTPTIQNVRLQKLAMHDSELVATGYAGAILNSTTLVPTVTDGTLTTKENTAVNGTLLAFGNGLTFAIAQPAHGKVTLTNTSSGTFTYTPANGFSGNDSFTFNASNSAGTSNTATESISVSENVSNGASSSTTGGGGGGGLGLLSLLVLTSFCVIVHKRRLQR